MPFTSAPFTPDYNPYYYPILGAACVGVIVVYWFIYKRHALLANILAFGALVGMLCYLTNWDYALRQYFFISNWKLP